MRQLTSFALAAAVALCFAAAGPAAQTPGTCSPPGTATCDPNGVPVPPGGGGGTPSPPSGGSPTPAATVPTVNALTAVVTLGGGRAVNGAEGVALDPTTGLVYIGLNGAIISGCEGDPIRGGAPLVMGPGAGQLSIVNPAQAREIAAVRTGQAPIWPTVDPERGLVYMMGSGGAGTVTVHNAADGTVIRTITVGGRPHQGGLDYTTRLMLVGNTVRSSDVLAEQNHASLVNVDTNAIAVEIETSPAPHGVVVDQERHVGYFSAVGDGAVVAVDTTTGQVLYSGIPKAAFGTSFGGNNMLTRQAATRRLFQVNTQAGATGVLVVDEVTLTADSVVRLAGNGIPWGLWVDEPNRLLFAAVPLNNAISVVDLDTLTHVADVPVGACPYAVAVDPVRRVAVVSNQGTPTENATASILDMCPVYAATGRIVDGCSVIDIQRRARPTIRRAP